MLVFGEKPLSVLRESKPINVMSLRAFLPFVALLYTGVHANNIVVSNGTLAAINTTEGRANVRFSLMWENSWRIGNAPNNWDAAWVFVKYKDNTGVWHHARLGSDAQHVSPLGATVTTGLLYPGTVYDAITNWGVGAFVYRSADGTGTFSVTNMELRWNYASNGIAYTDIAQVQVFALEMVLVPQGDFYLGSGGSESNCFKNGSTNDGLLITGEGEIAVGAATGHLNYVSAAWSGDASGPVPSTFPKGWAGFYCMKHEVAQGDYVAFLNTLTRTQQNGRTATNLAAGVTSVTNRYVMSNTSSINAGNGIRCNGTIDGIAPINFYCDLNNNGTGNGTTDGQWVACNYLSWADLAAYLDWSGLRPMTELEYEKACRGAQTPVANEYAWGSTTITAVASATSPGRSNEASGTIGANAVYGSGSPAGPRRVGLVATGGATRIQAGAGYHGALDLSGNIGELTVTVGNSQGRAYTGVHGNGSIDLSGIHDAGNWPTGGQGVGFRGGFWYFGPLYLTTSNRTYAAYGSSVRDTAGGGRGVRLVP